MLNQLFLCVATCKICFSASSAVLGNSLTPELPPRSGYPASLRVFIYLGIDLTLNEAKIAEGGSTQCPVLTSFSTFISFKSLWKCQRQPSSSHSRQPLRLWTEFLTQFLFFLSMTYFRAHFTARCAGTLPFFFFFFLWLWFFLCFFRPFSAILITLFCSQKLSCNFSLSSSRCFDETGSELLKWLMGQILQKQELLSLGFDLVSSDPSHTSHPGCTICNPRKVSVWESQWKISVLYLPSTYGCCKVLQC